MANLIEIWKKRGKILEGIRHSIFKREDVEEIADDRLLICRTNKCGFHDPHGMSPVAVVRGAESCASCGCKLAWKTRALSDECPEGWWKAVVSEIEEAVIREHLGMREGEE